MLLMMLALYTSVPDYPVDHPNPGCETYEEDCIRDNDGDGRQDNEEEDGGGF
jgi:hypothetical protein